MIPRGYGSRGFTVLELLVVVAITAILLSLAIPSYQAYLQRGHRADAARYLLAVASCQERIRASSGYYDLSRCLDAPPKGTYRFTLQASGHGDGQSFLVLASPVGHAPDYCGALGLDHQGTRSISGDTGKLARCWGGR